MKKILLPVSILILFLILSCRANKTDRSQANTQFTISGFIQETHAYCGGAAPPEELLHPKPIGRAGIKLYIKKGIANSEKSKLIDSIVSGENGAFSIQLPEGDYCLVEAAKKGKCIVPANNPYTTWDSACYIKEYARCDYSLSVKSDQKNLTIVFARYCPWTQPCSDYQGPLPPAANPGPKHQE